MSENIPVHFGKTNNRRWIAIIAMVFIAIIVINIGLRIASMIATKKETLREAIPVVMTMIVQKGTGHEQIILPGNVQAWHEATIYARTDGYIKKWYVDIGAKVKKGELLAEIEAPELDAQLRQATANLNTAIVNNQLAQSTAKRWANLLKTDSVSKQEADEKMSTAAALKAEVIAAQANLDRLKELVGFERVVAPFDGTIISRTTDTGALINAGSSSNGVALFKIAQTDTLRVYVNVPQNYSSQIKPDMTVKLRFAEHPGEEFVATLVETAKAIDPATRTMLTQFKVNNDDNRLFAGSYAEVIFSFPVPSQTIRLPVNALLFQAAGLEVATVNQEQRVVLKPITINRDFGSEVEIASGLAFGERVILNPSDSIVDGEKVEIFIPKNKNPSTKGSNPTSDLKLKSTLPHLTLNHENTAMVRE